MAGIYTTAKSKPVAIKTNKVNSTKQVESTPHNAKMALTKKASLPVKNDPGLAKARAEVFAGAAKSIGGSAEKPKTTTLPSGKEGVPIRNKPQSKEVAPSVRAIPPTSPQDIPPSLPPKVPDNGSGFVVPFTKEKGLETEDESSPFDMFSDGIDYVKDMGGSIVDEAMDLFKEAKSFLMSMNCDGKTSTETIKLLDVVVKTNKFREWAKFLKGIKPRDKSFEFEANVKFMGVLEDVLSLGDPDLLTGLLDCFKSKVGDLFSSGIGMFAKACGFKMPKMVESLLPFIGSIPSLFAKDGLKNLAKSMHLNADNIHSFKRLARLLGIEPKELLTKRVKYSSRGTAINIYDSNVIIDMSTNGPQLINNIIDNSRTINNTVINNIDLSSLCKKTLECVKKSPTKVTTEVLGTPKSMGNGNIVFIPDGSNSNTGKREKVLDYNGTGDGIKDINAVPDGTITLDGSGLLTVKELAEPIMESELVRRYLVYGNESNKTDDTTVLGGRLLGDDTQQHVLDGTICPICGKVHEGAPLSYKKPPWLKLVAKPQTLAFE